MSPLQYSAAGSGTALLAQLIMWLSHWPITAPTEPQADAAAGLLVLFGGSVHGLVNAFFAKKLAAPATLEVKP